MNPYQTSGTYSGLAYVERKADRELKKAILDNKRIPYVLAPRQSGKSSLLVHTMSSLKPEKILCVWIDLQELCSKGSVQGYDNFLGKLEKQILKKLECNKHISEREELIPILQSVLKNFSERIVIFIDEVDALQDKNFCDDFLSLIRATFNKRAREPEFKRIQFVLSGAISIYNLIKNPHVSPFNVGTEIVLTDFNLDELSELTLPLANSGVRVNYRFIQEMFEWCSGSVFLSHYILEKAWEHAHELENSEVDEQIVINTVDELIEKAENHVHFTNIYKLLDTNLILKKKLVDWEKGRQIDTPSQNELCLAGISGVKTPYRNNIYKNVFSTEGRLELINPKKLEIITPKKLIASIFILVFCGFLFFEIFKPPEITFCKKTFSLSTTEIICSDREVSDLTPLKELKNLQRLYLKGTRVSDLTALIGIDGLQYINLRNTQVSFYEIENLKEALPCIEIEAPEITFCNETFSLLSTEIWCSEEVRDLTPLKDLKNLTQLDLGYTQVRDLTPLKDLKNLTHLDLSATSVRDLTPLKDLNNLTQLNLNGTPVHDFTPLKNLRNLTQLDLLGTQISDLTSLKDLKNLTQLDLRRTPVSDLTSLKDLKSLTQLGLWETKVSDLSPLKDLNNLTQLDLSVTSVRDLSPLKDLNNLTQLNLNGTPVHDFTPLKDLNNLTQLDLLGTQISDLGSLKNLKNLTQLNLAYTKISVLSPLKDLNNITQLNLKFTPVHNFTPLKDLRNLTQLNLAYTKISDLSPLKDLNNITQLDLRNTSVSDLTSLKDLKNLTQLNIKNTRVSTDDNGILRNSLPYLLITY